MTHLQVLENRLRNEQARFSAAKTAAERAVRASWVKQTMSEIEVEKQFFGNDMSDDELFAALEA